MYKEININIFYKNNTDRKNIQLIISKFIYKRIKARAIQALFSFNVRWIFHNKKENRFNLLIILGR